MAKKDEGDQKNCSQGKGTQNQGRREEEETIRVTEGRGDLDLWNLAVHPQGWTPNTKVRSLGSRKGRLIEKKESATILIGKARKKKYCLESSAGSFHKAQKTGQI